MRVAVTRSGERAVQDENEFAQYLDLVKRLNVRRYLEIGCRHGDTFFAVMQTIGSGGYGMAIDLPRTNRSRDSARAAVMELRENGIEADVKFGNSHFGVMREFATNKGPFDLALIDGDHRYEGVKQDWDDYRHLAPVIALHDIAAPDGHTSEGNLIGVPKFWGELRPLYRHEEYVTQGSDMGFGIIHQ
jgi:hypothetical protein